MPGPPAPFVPTPLPNIASSGTSPKGYSKKVKIEGQTVAIRGATFASKGDMPSKGTGGGLVSANTHGPAKFITPGSPTVEIEGKSVHLLAEPMLNNCGPTGNPTNTGATMTGDVQLSAAIARRMDQLQEIACECDQEIKHENADGTRNKRSCQFLGILKHACCESKIKKKTRQGTKSGVKGETGYYKTSTNQITAARSSSAPAGSSWPDAAITDGSGNPQKFVDFKFACPDNDPPRKQTWTKYSAEKQAKHGFSDQRDKYKDLTKRLGLDPKDEEHKPELITNEKCP